MLKSNQSPIVWVHCASLGEFEQARTFIEKFKTEFPNYKILLTFFSPSGFEVRKNYDKADYIFYLPWDTRENAERFVHIVNPKIALFIKYEFWRNYIQALDSQNIPILSVSSIFRKDQIFFKSYGFIFRSTLKRIDHFFVQNDLSKKLLQTIGINNVTISGDTRFDRVNQIVSQSHDIPIVEQFKGSDNVFVVGSCWPEDLALLAPHINNSIGKLKFIIAPHEIKESFIEEIKNATKAKSILYSEANDKSGEYDILIIDNIGMLSSLYRYGEYAYIGGGLGKGLHNTLEAACYGIPIFFGDKNYTKFQEAKDLIMRGGAFEVGDYAALKNKFESMINRPENYLLACEVTKAYVEENLGATDKVINYCHQLLDNEG